MKNGKGDLVFLFLGTSYKGNMLSYKKVLSLILLFIFSFLSVFWVLSVDNSFNYDDTTWMLTVSNSSYAELFHFFPHSVYLDRPVGVIFLKFLYDAFGLDYCRHHVVLVIIHLLNVLMCFLDTREIFKCQYNDDAKSYGGGGNSCWIFWYLEPDAYGCLVGCRYF